MNIGTILARIVGLTLLGIIQLGCGKSGNNQEKPQSDQAVGVLSVPSPLSMSLNLNVDASSSDIDTLILQKKMPTVVKSSANHLQAIVYVSAIKTNIAQPLKLPINLLISLEGMQPTQMGTDAWVYSFDVLENNRVWTANLTATRFSSMATSWTMKVSSDPSDINGCCNDVVLFEGRSSATGSGTWQIYDVSKPRDSAKLFSIVYDYKTPSDKVLLFTMNGEVGPTRLGRNSTVRYSASADAMALEISDSSDQGKRFISWSAANKSGEHTDPQKNSVCWDTYLNNFSDMSCK